MAAPSDANGWFLALGAPPTPAALPPVPRHAPVPAGADFDWSGATPGTWNMKDENGEIVTCRRGPDYHFSPPYSLDNFLRLFPTCLDARRYNLMRYCGTQEKITVVESDSRGREVRREHRTRYGAWTQRWRHWGGRGALYLRCKGPNVDMPYVRCQEESKYQALVAEFVAGVKAEGSSASIPPVSVDLVFFRHPYDNMWFVNHVSFWQRDMDFEVRARSRNHKARVFMGWHNVDGYSLISVDRARVFVDAVKVGWPVLEPSRWIIAPSPPVFAYYSNLVVDNHFLSPLIVNIAKAEFAVICCLRFLAVCKWGALDNYGADGRVTSYNGIIVPLPDALWSLIDEVGVENCVFRSSSFPMPLVLMAVRRSRLDIDWSLVPGEIDEKFLPYDFERGVVSPLADSWTSYSTDSHGNQVETERPAVPVVPWKSDRESLTGVWREVKMAAAQWVEANYDVCAPVHVTDDAPCVDRDRHLALREKLAAEAREAASRFMAVSSPGGVGSPEPASVVEAAAESATGAVADDVEALRAELESLRASVAAHEAERDQWAAEKAELEAAATAQAAEHRAALESAKAEWETVKLQLEEEASSTLSARDSAHRAAHSALKLERDQLHNALRTKSAEYTASQERSMAAWGAERQRLEQALKAAKVRLMSVQEDWDADAANLRSQLEAAVRLSSSRQAEVHRLRRFQEGVDGFVQSVNPGAGIPEVASRLTDAFQNTAAEVLRTALAEFVDSLRGSSGDGSSGSHSGGV